MSHKLVRAIIAEGVIKLIMENRKVSQDMALDMFYGSKIAESFADDETGLYGQSALYIFSLFEEEQK